MPIYEFRCQGCRQRVTLFQRSVSAPVATVCPHCGSTDLQRLVSQFAVLKSESSLYDYDDPFDDAMLEEMAGLEDASPREMAAWARKMKARMGEDLGPEFDEMIDRLEAGESLEEPGEGDDESLEDADFE